MNVYDFINSRLMGAVIEINQPITPLNPHITTTITGIKFKRGKIFIKGEDSAWFEGKSINLPEAD